VLVNNNVAGSSLGLHSGNFDEDKILIETKNRYEETFLRPSTWKFAVEAVLYPHLTSQLHGHATEL
jgi:hypothetical protein